MRKESERLELLNKLAEQVPYFDALQNAVSRLDHVTTSVLGHQYNKPATPTRGFNPMNGFTDERVFKDAKFRLGLALRAAGVHTSTAARDAIASLCPRQQAPW